jgi:glyoxylase-like metal-dependent hydrolase (beta-lactamase superfamily II)
VKRFLVLLVVIPLLLVVLAGVATIPAHLQIRTIHPALPAFDTLARALDVADGPIGVSYVNTASQRSPLGTLGHPGVLITWPDGRQFLVDTGMPPDEAIAFGRPMETILGADPTVTHGSLDEQLGSAVNDIRGIGFTHLHSDHTGGLPAICAAQAKPATVYQSPLQSRELNYTTKMGLEALEVAVCERKQLVEGVVMSVPGFPGLAAVSLGGHTPGSTLFAARVGHAYWLFSGDITNDKKSLSRDLPKHWLYSLLIVPEDTTWTARLRKYLAAMEEFDGVIVLPAHDIGVMAESLPPAGTTRLGAADSFR